MYPDALYSFKTHALGTHVTFECTFFENGLKFTTLLQLNRAENVILPSVY